MWNSGEDGADVANFNVLRHDLSPIFFNIAYYIQRFLIFTFASPNWQIHVPGFESTARFSK